MLREATHSRTKQTHGDNEIINKKDTLYAFDIHGLDLTIGQNDKAWTH